MSVDVNIETAISWSFIGVAALILAGFAACSIAVVRLHESDVANWGELSADEEREADALGPKFTRLMWAGGVTALDG